MLSRCLLALGLQQLAGAASDQQAASRETRYRRLRNPVYVPLQSVRQVWQPAPFRARCAKTEAGGGSGTEVLLRGILLRLPSPRPAGSDGGLKAFSLKCPHEICDLNFADDPGSVRWAPGARRNHPVLVCPCHFSVFDPLADGAAISGPAERGAYRFRVKVRGNRVEIREVEEAALG